MDGSSQEMTAFVIHSGLHEIRVMSLGYVMAPAQLHRSMETVLAGLVHSVCIVHYRNLLLFCTVKMFVHRNRMNFFDEYDYTRISFELVFRTSMWCICEFNVVVHGVNKLKQSEVVVECLLKVRALCLSKTMSIHG